MHKQGQTPGAPCAECIARRNCHRCPCQNHSRGTPVSAPSSRSYSCTCSKCRPDLGPDGAPRWDRTSVDGPGKKALPLLWLPVVGSEL